MDSAKLMWSVLLGCALVVAGCEQKDETPSGTPTNVPQASEAAAEDAKDAAEDAADRMKEAAGDTADAVKKQAETVSDSVKQQADAAANAAASSPEAAEATKQIEQVMTYIKENKLELAEATLSKLEEKKASLPAAVQAQVANARTMLDTAKKAAKPAAPAPAN